MNKKEINQEELNDFMRETARLGISMTKLGIFLSEKISDLEERIIELELLIKRRKL